MDQKKRDAGPLPVQGGGDRFAPILEQMTGRSSSLAKGTGLTNAAFLEAVSEAVAGAVGEAVANGTDLTPATKAIVVGVLRGTEAKDEAALKILSTTARTVIHHTADRGGNLAAASKGLVLGAIASAKAMGVDVAKAASTAAQGAYEGAVSAGPVTLERVVGALKESIGGIRIALPAPHPI